MKYEAIVLSGGEGWRLKPDTWTPKPLLEIKDKETLIDVQVHWLLKHKFDNIILSSNRSFSESSIFTNKKVQPCIEKTKLGTGGAVYRASSLIDSEIFYVMNIDDIVFYNPRRLYDKATSGASILLAKPQLPFGKVSMKEDLITTFKQRPSVDIWVNAGHYVFTKEIVKKHFPVEGDFELKTMQIIAKKSFLKGLKYDGDWLTLNTMKDLIRIREYFTLKASKKKSKK